MLNAKKDLIVYCENNWPIGKAVESLQSGDYNVELCFDLYCLNEKLNKPNNQPLILIIQPREQVHLLSGIIDSVKNRNITIVSEKIYFSDRVIVRLLNEQYLLNINMIKLPECVSELRSRLKEINEGPYINVIKHSLTSPSKPLEIFSKVRIFAMHEFSLRGLNYQERFIIDLLFEGTGINMAARILGANLKDASRYKINALRKIEMTNSLGNILFGGYPKESLQKHSASEVDFYFDKKHLKK